MEPTQPPIHLHETFNWLASCLLAVCSSLQLRFKSHLLLCFSGPA
jgi:hypothetical protein